MFLYIFSYYISNLVLNNLHLCNLFQRNILLVKFGSVPAALNYDQASHSITIRDIATANYSLPIEKLVVTPAKVDGKYLVSTKYSVNGTVGIAESAVNKATVDKLSGAQIAFQASIPEIRAKSISVDELACNLDQSFKFSIMDSSHSPAAG